MKQLISVLVAAMFAAVSATAVAQDKGEKKDKATTAQADKKPAKAKAASKKTKTAKTAKKEGASAEPMKDEKKK